MKELTYSELKINLVHYFLKVEKYSADKNSSEDCSYLINPNAKYNIIVISYNSYNVEILNALKASTKLSKHAKANVLNIVLSNSYKEEGSIIINDPLFYKDKLIDLFPKISKLKITSNSDEEEEVSEEDIIEMLKNPESAKNKELQELTKKIKVGFTPVAWTIGFLFFGLPIVCYILSTLMQTKNSYMSYGTISSLFFGGTDRNLTILGGQFWRILTYGFNAGPSNSMFALIESLVIGYLLYSSARYVEAAIGHLKLSVTVFVSYLLTGMFMSSIPGIITGGSYGSLAAIVAILGLSSGRRKTAISYISKAKTIMPSIVLVLFPMFDGNIYNYLVLFVGLGFSGSITFLWSYNYKKIEYDFAAPLFIVGSLFILSIVLMFAYSPIPAYSAEDIYTLQSYLVQNILFSQQGATNVLHNIGWTSLSFEGIRNSDGSIVYQLFTDGEWR